MTKNNLPLKVTASLAALAVTALAAPAACAGESGFSKASSHLKSNVAAQVGREMNTRGARGNRGDRTRGDRTRGDRTRTDRTRGDRTRGDRTRGDRNRRTERRTRPVQRTYRGGNRGYSTRNGRSYNNGYRAGTRTAYRNVGVNGFGNLRRGAGFRQAGFYSPYRSNLGISFSFGSPGYSSYRWARSPYAFYRPGRLSYASYSAGTRCQRVIVDGFQYGTLRPISVKQCYNPWDGYYIIQGSERIARNVW